MKIKVSETQLKALKMLAAGVTATYVHLGRFSNAHWTTKSRSQCTGTMNALRNKGLVEFVKREGSSVDHDVLLTALGREVIGAHHGGA